MDSQCGRAVCTTPPLPPLSPCLSLWRVHLFVSQQNCCLHSQHSTKIPKLKLSRNEAAEEGEEGGERVLLVYSQVVSLARHFLLIDVM